MSLNRKQSAAVARKILVTWAESNTTATRRIVSDLGCYDETEAGRACRVLGFDAAWEIVARTIAQVAS